MRAFWLCLAGGLLIAAAPARADVWLEPATVKVLKTASVPEDIKELQLSAVRNEYVAFQVVVRSTVALDAVDVTLSDFVGEGGAVIGADNGTLYLEHYHEVVKPSPCDIFFSPQCALYPEFHRDPGFYPDALIPFFDPYDDAHGAVAVPFAAAADDVQTVFVDLLVPADAPPGDYAATVSVTDKGEVIAELSLGLHVFDVVLPTKRNVATAFGFGLSEVKKFHGGPEGPDDESYQKLLQNYEWEVHRHRMDFTTHYPGLSFEFDENDQLKPIDFSAYDAYIGPRVDGSYYPDGAGINRFNLGIFRPGHGTLGLTDSQFQQAAKAVFEHLEEKGYLEHVYLYSTDEPWMIEHWQNGSFEKIQQTMALLDGVTDLHRGHVLVTGPWQEIIGDLVDIWCPVTPMYGDVYWPAGSWPGADKYQQLLAAGRELWFYVCNANFPGLMGYDLDSPLGHEPRLTKWGAWAEGATGFLYWRLTYWFDSDPWNSYANWEHFGDQFSRNGDGVLIYPGDHDGTAGGKGSPATVAMDGPVVSFRMKQIRDGLEDWELFIMAEELGAEESVRERVATVYRAFGEPLNDEFDISDPPWSLEPTALLPVRDAVAAKVQHLLHPELYPDPDAPPVVEENPVVEVVEPVPDVVAAPDLATAEMVTDPDVAVAEPGTTTTGSRGCDAGGAGAPGNLLLLLLALVICSVAAARRLSHG